MAEKLEFDLLVKNNNLNKALDSAAKSADQLSDAINNGVNSDNIDKVTEATKNLNNETNSFLKSSLAVAAGQFAFTLVRDAVNFLSNSIRDSVAAFSEQEDAINKLNQSLRVTGSFSQSASDGIVAFASSLEATSKFSDDAIIAQVAFVKSLGATNQGAKDLVLAAANLSATLGGSLEENVDKLGKTLSGTSGRLAQYIPELKSLTTEQLKAGAAADIINQKFGGSAANDLKTFSGQTASLANSFNNLQETIGEAIVKSSLFSDSITAIKGKIDSLNSSLALTGVGVTNAAGGMTVQTKTAEQYATEITKLNVVIEDYTKKIDALPVFDPSQNLFGEDPSIVLQSQLDQLIKVRDEIEAKLQTSKLSTPKETPEQARVSTRTQDEVDAEKKKNDEILALKKQLSVDIITLQAQSAVELQAQDAQLNALGLESIMAQDLAKIEALYAQKIAEAQVVYEGELLKNESIKNAEQQQLANDKAFETLKLTALKAQGQKEVEEKNKINALKKKSDDDYKANLGSTLDQIATLQTSGNKTLVAVGKAAALSQLAISGPVAVGKAFELGPIIGPIAAAAVTASFAVQAAKVAGVAFAGGGFINGNGGATMGPDTTTAQVRDGEMVLNGAQQKQLFDAINSGGVGGGNIQVIIDGREVAIAVRNQIQSGFRLA